MWGNPAITITPSELPPPQQPEQRQMAGLNGVWEVRRLPGLGVAWEVLMWFSQPGMSQLYAADL
jgi:hypothetical protein